MGTCNRDANGEATSGRHHEGREYGCAMAGAEQRVVAKKSSIKGRGAKSAVSRGNRLAGSTGNGRNSRASGRSAISHETRSQLDGSRMTRECHVRFCEGLGVKLPGLLSRARCAGKRLVPVLVWLSRKTRLLRFQCEGVNIVRSHVANQHWRVCRIKAHPKGERPCVTESLQIDNALRIATRYADSKHTRIIPRGAGSK